MVPLKIEKAGDLIFWTYYMFDWSKVGQRPSGFDCAECGRPMLLGEQAVDAKGQKYDSYVCHNDKRLTWVKVA
jgi:hypothetical protein